MSNHRTIKVFAPASVGNFGPFFDVMGYCLDYLGDVVEATPTTTHDSVRLVNVTGPFATALGTETDLANNAVQIVARYICAEKQFYNNISNGIDITLHKLMPLKTGLGSSSASAVGAAKVLFSLLNIDHCVSDIDKARAALAGELYSSDHAYYDNVVPSYFGGVKIIKRGTFVDIECPMFWTVAIILDRLQLSTGQMRHRLFDHLLAIITQNDHDEAAGKIAAYLRFQSSSAAMFVRFLRDGNLRDAGMIISDETDNILYEARHGQIPYYRELTTVMKAAGACGRSISGSGPAVFCIAENESSALHVKDRVVAHFKNNDVWWLVSPLNRVGARVIDNTDEWIAHSSVHHNFWT